MELLVIGLIFGLASIITGFMMPTINKKNSKELMDYQSEVDMEDFGEQMAMKDEYDKNMMQWQWDRFNSPSAQAKAYTEAGYAPELALGTGQYGTISGGSSSAPGGSVSPSNAGSVPFASMMSSMLNGLTSSGQLGLQSEKQDAEIEKLKAEASYWQAERARLEGENPMGASQIRQNNASAAVDEQNAINLGISERILANEAYISDSLKDLNISDAKTRSDLLSRQLSLLDQEVEQAIEKVRQLRNSNEFDEATFQTRVDMYRADLSNKLLENRVLQYFAEKYEYFQSQGMNDLEISAMQQETLSLVLANEDNYASLFGQAMPGTIAPDPKRIEALKRFEVTMRNYRKQLNDINFHDKDAWRRWFALQGSVNTVINDASGVSMAGIAAKSRTSAAAIRTAAKVVPK